MSDFAKVCQEIVKLRDHVIHLKGQLSLDLTKNQSICDRAAGQIRGYDQALEILECVRKGEEYHV